MKKKTQFFQQNSPLGPAPSPDAMHIFEGVFLGVFFVNYLGFFLGIWAK